MKQYILMITSKPNSWNLYKQICLYNKYNSESYIFEMIYLMSCYSSNLSLLMKTIVI